MTEIPMPGPSDYQPAKKSSATSDCCKIAGIICVILIIGMVVIAVVFMGSILSFFGGITGGTGYSTRTIASYSNEDIDLYSTYYYNEFSVSSSETLSSTAPDIRFVINVWDTGSDSVTTTIHVAVYELTKATFDSISTWSGLDPYLVESGNYTNSASDFFNLNNYSDTYVWVIWFDASSKTSVWQVNIDLTLRYNWNL
jgi:flagellar basal body-associated protein FliL